MRNLLIAMLGIGILDSCVAEDVSSSDGLYVGLGMSIIHDKLQSDFISVPAGQPGLREDLYNLYDSTGKTSYDPTIILGCSFKLDMPLFVALEASYSFANKRHSTLQDCTGGAGTPLALKGVFRNYQIGSEIRGLLKVGYKAQNYAAYVLGGISSRSIKYVFAQPSISDERNNIIYYDGVENCYANLSKACVAPVIGVGVRYSCRDYAVSFEVSKVWNRSVSCVTSGVDTMDNDVECQRFHSMKVKNNIDVRLTFSKSVNMF